MASALTASEDLSTLWPLVRARLLNLCGLVLTEDQIYLLTRLEPVARVLGFTSVAAFLKPTLAGGRDDLDRALVEAMTTHETSFFRDGTFWETLRARILPQLIALRRPIHIWSAACSSGQEPYSIAIGLKEWYPTLDFSLWATDIAVDTLARAQRGVYSQDELARGLTPAQIAMHFEPEPPGFRVKNSIRQSMRFDVYNLLGSEHPLRSADLILCRNVLVYFTDATRERVMTRLSEALTPQGWLGLGGTELPLRSSNGLARFQDGGGWLHRSK